MKNLANYVSFRGVVQTALLTALILLSLTFVVFQARYLIIGPQISITEQPEGPQNERQVFIAGGAHNISHLWLNGRPIYTDMQGNFREALVLENGYTVVTLRAEDRYGRSTEVTRTLVYSPSSFNRITN